MMSILYIVWIAAGTCAAVVLTQSLRDGRARDRQARNRCRTCGYDLRASKGNCPECNTPIPLRRQDILESGFLRVKTDVPCVGCSANLRGKLIIDPCETCGHSNSLSIRSDVAGSLGVSLDQVNFITNAIREYSRREKRSDTSVPRHKTTREVCLAVRDHALRRAGDSVKARAQLVDLGIHSSDAIGAVIWASVERGTLITTVDDKPELFQGLFTLDQLMKAEPSDTSITENEHNHPTRSWSRDDS